MSCSSVRHPFVPRAAPEIHGELKQGALSSTDVDPMFVASQSPFKIRMPPCLNALLRRGDNVECTIRKAQGASFWLPLASGCAEGSLALSTATRNKLT